MTKELFKVFNRFTGEVAFTAEIDCKPDELPLIKLGLAVKWAIKARANLADTDLTRADLTGAYLTHANLVDTDLTGADLADTDLTRADLTRADLTRADLTRADLTGADLTGANLARANLTGADLTGADLTGANLVDTDLTRANLVDAKNAELAIARTRILPEGDLIGWKKCQDGVIVKLRIPEAAKRSHAFGRKCRAEFADVLEVIGAEIGISSHDGETEYRVGQRVKPDSFYEDWTQECAGGIHFMISRIEAENY